MAFDGDKKWGGKHEVLMARAMENFQSLMEAQAESCWNCESEIERMLAFVFFANDRIGAYNDIYFRYQTRYWGFKSKVTLGDAVACVEDTESVYVFPQVEIGDFRLDFLCILRYAPIDSDRDKFLYLAIECDGHEFHEKSKVRAAKDKLRDRLLLTHGIPSMRFTGSEIWADAYDCMLQIDRYFAQSLQRLVYPTLTSLSAPKRDGE